MKRFVFLFSCALVLSIWISPARSAAATGSWSMTGSLHTARVSPIAVTLPNGNVLVTGGFNNPNTYATSELWDPTTGQMHFVRIADSVTLLRDGTVLVAGGEGSTSLVAQSETYDPATEQWRLGPSLHTLRWVQSAVRLADGRVLVAGGETADFVPITSAEIYTP